MVNLAKYRTLHVDGHYHDLYAIWHGYAVINSIIHRKHCTEKFEKDFFE